MRRFFSRTELLLAVWCVSAFSLAQSTQPGNHGGHRQSISVSHIRGVVADENKGVIRRVKVTLQKAKGSELEDVASVESNGAGRFDFPSVPAGQYRLKFGFPGFCPADVPVEVLSTGWNGFWLTMTVAAMDSREPCDDKYKAEEWNRSSSEIDKPAK